MSNHDTAGFTLGATTVSPSLSGVTEPAKQPVEATNRQIVANAFDKWRDHSGSFFDILSEDAKWTIVGTSAAAKTYSSKQAFLCEVIQPFNARLSVPLKPTVRALYADGDTVIALWDGEGTARDGKPYRNTYTWYLRLGGDKVVDAIAFFDTVEFNRLWRRVSPGAAALH